MKDDELLKIAIKDLVNLSVKANNVILEGSFPGKYSEEVMEVLNICKHVYETFAIELQETVNEKK